MSTPTPGWYPDPADGARVRWWDGTSWTEHVNAWPQGSPGATPSSSGPPGQAGSTGASGWATPAGGTPTAPTQGTPTQGTPTQGTPTEVTPTQGTSSPPGAGWPPYGPGTGTDQGQPGQGQPGQGQPGPGQPGQGWSGQGWSGQGWSGQGWSGQGWSTGEGSSGQSAPTAGYPPAPAVPSPGVPGAPPYPGGYAGVPAYQGYGPQPGVTPDGAVLSGWWRRGVAYLVDGIITATLTLVLAASSIATILDRWSVFLRESFPPGVERPPPLDMSILFNDPEFRHAVMVYQLTALATSAVYFIVLTALLGATLGKLLLGIRVRRIDRPGAPGWGRAALRWLAGPGTGLLQLVPVVGLLTSVYRVLDLLFPLWDARNQTIHDKAAGTVVVRRTPPGGYPQDPARWAATRAAVNRPWGEPPPR